jgi:excisionase family DNA binding protein
MSTHTPTPSRAGLLTPAKAATVAKVSKDTIYRLIGRGELRALHIGRQLRIHPTDFADYLPERSSSNDR